MGTILDVNKIVDNRQKAKEIANKVIKIGNKEGKKFGDILQDELSKINKERNEDNA